jgi:aryl-alcohol dehydrogenase-like predicted oxidoreductase
LGSQGPELSVIGFGAMEVGETEGWDDRPSDDVLVDVIRSALDAGINWIDTAEVYGDGNSERLVGEALAGGLFGPHLPSEEELRATLGERAWARRGPAVLDLLRAIHPMAERAAMSVPQLALAWTLEHPGVTSPIVGSTNPEHIREAAEAGDVGLDDADLTELNALVERVRDAVGV